MSRLYYFAYGSNLHPVRLTARVPSARLLGLKTVPGYRLCFHKRHHEDGSGKCNMFYTGREEDVVIGAIYEMAADQKPLLDRCEGPGYRCDTLAVDMCNEQYECFVYIAEDSHIDDTLVPHCWYKNIVLLGAEFHSLPENYLTNIREVEAGTDPDEDQHRQHYRLIDEMRAYSAENE
jgi:gamma-glutamylcyclotransferase